MNASRPETPDQIDQLVQAVQNSAKYRTISAELIRRIGSRELAIRRNLKTAIKETKNRLHQIAGAYLDKPPRYAEWLAALEAAARNADATAVRATCIDIMSNHTSTRERVPILAEFYAALFAAIPPPQAVIDLACGLNPLARPWMPLAPDVTYHACDIYIDLATFLNRSFTILQTPGEAHVCDLITAPPTQCYDAAFVFKTLPVLDQMHQDAGRDLLRAINANAIFVSFPTRSLGGRARGMPANYGERFRALAAAEGWSIQAFEFATELAFLVRKA